VLPFVAKFIASVDSSSSVASFRRVTRRLRLGTAEEAVTGSEPFCSPSLRSNAVVEEIAVLLEGKVRRGSNVRAVERAIADSSGDVPDAIDKTLAF
jgi:hypothetical protein